MSVDFCLSSDDFTNLDDLASSELDIQRLDSYRSGLRIVQMFTWIKRVIDPFDILFCVCIF